MDETERRIDGRTFFSFFLFLSLPPSPLSLTPSPLQYNRWGALIRTLTEFSMQAVGREVSYVQFPHLALTITSDPRTKLLCALFHDPDVRLFSHYRHTN